MPFLVALKTAHQVQHITVARNFEKYQRTCQFVIQVLISFSYVQLSFSWGISTVANNLAIYLSAGLEKMPKFWYFHKNILLVFTKKVNILLTSWLLSQKNCKYFQTNVKSCQIFGKISKTFQADRFKLGNFFQFFVNICQLFGKLTILVVKNSNYVLRLYANFFCQ